MNNVPTNDYLSTVVTGAGVMCVVIPGSSMGDLHSAVRRPETTKYETIATDS